jgi:hypothetical protein
LIRPELGTNWIASSGRLPKDGYGPIHGRAHEEPLPTTEMARARNQGNCLVQIAELNP